MNSTETTIFPERSVEEDGVDEVGIIKWSHVSGPRDSPLLSLTVGQLLERAAVSYGDKTFVVFPQQNIRKSFRQVLQEADQVAAGLLSLNLLAKGDRIGIWAPNSYQWLLTQFAAARAGLVLVNLNPAYRANELQYSMNLVEVKVLVMANRFRRQSLLEVLKDILMMDGKMNNESDAICSPQLPHLKRIITISDETVPWTTPWPDLLEKSSSLLIDQVHSLQNRIELDEPSNILFTSGTTGKPKGATLSHHGMVNNSHFVGRRMGYHETSDHILCVPLPLHHIFACRTVLTAASHGLRLVFPGPYFSACEMARAVQQEKCTVFYATPTMAMDILGLAETKEFDLSSLTTGVISGAVCPIELTKSIANDLNVKDLRNSYGMTETVGSTFLSLKTDSMAIRCSTTGYVMDHCEVKIVDPLNGEILPVNTPGEICTKGYSTMLGYWNQPDKTDEVLTKDRWFHSGDVGMLDENGYLQIVGRIKDVIIRGGENIYPREIEEVLHTHPGIQEAQVVGVPDARLGEDVCAWIRSKPEQIGNISQEELKTFCKEKMAYFKVPRYWLIDESPFPATVTGKVQKFALKEMAIKALGL